MTQTTTQKPRIFFKDNKRRHIKFLVILAGRMRKIVNSNGANRRGVPGGYVCQIGSSRRSSKSAHGDNQIDEDSVSIGCLSTQICSSHGSSKSAHGDNQIDEDSISEPSMVPGTFSFAGSKFVNGVKKGVQIVLTSVMLATTVIGGGTVLTGCPIGPELQEDYDEYGFHKITGFHKEREDHISGNLWNEQGNRKDGAYYRDDDGYDFQGYKGNTPRQTDGWHSDGNGFGPEPRKPHDNQGKMDDGVTHWYSSPGPDGYDFQDIKRNGWHKDGGYGVDRSPFNTNNGMLEDGVTPWTDEHGYDWKGLNDDGWQKLDPIAAVKMPVIRDTATQQNAEFNMGDVRWHLAANAGEIYDHFAKYFSTNSPYPPLVAAAIKANNTAVMPLTYINPLTGPPSQPGHEIMNYSLSMIEEYIAEIVQGFDDVVDQNRIRELIHAFRIDTYVKARKINNTSTGAKISNPNPSIAERDTLFGQLGLNDNNFEQVINEEIRRISNEFQINPGHIRTLFNQMATVESGYAVVDDIRALGLNARENIDSISDMPQQLRTLADIRQRLFNAEQSVIAGKTTPNPSINTDHIMGK